jgi:hypothetical protein
MEIMKAIMIKVENRFCKRFPGGEVDQTQTGKYA